MKKILAVLLLLLVSGCTTIEIQSKDGKVFVEAGKTFTNTQSMAADGNTVPVSATPK